MLRQANLSLDRVTTARKGAPTKARRRAGALPTRDWHAWCRVALRRERGLRENLEDAAGAITLCLGDRSLVGLVVCDGVGGQNGGEVAARLGVEAACTGLASNFAHGGLGDGCPATPDAVRGLVLEVVAQANRLVVVGSLQDPALDKMASTIVLAVIVDGILHTPWAGDSRCYLNRGTDLVQMTRDHRQNVCSPLPAESWGRAGSPSPVSNVITQCLGNRRSFSADYSARPLLDDDLILLCTDGLTDAVTDEEIARHIAAWRAGDCSLEDLPRRLAAYALSVGTTDNVTVLCCAYDDPSSVAMDSELPTRTVAYPAALAASFTKCAKEIDHA
jgi:PPM family protein phosphatase